MGTTAGGANFVGRRGCRGRGEAATGPDYHGDLLFTREVVTQTVKDLPAMWEMCVRSPGREEEPLEEGMATAPVHLPEESPRTGEAGGLQSTGSQRVGCAERLSRAKRELGWVSSHLIVQSVTQGCWRFARLMELGHGLPGRTREAQAEPTRSQRKERRCRAPGGGGSSGEPGGSARGLQITSHMSVGKSKSDSTSDLSFYLPFYSAALA